MSGLESDEYWRLDEFEDITSGLDARLEGSTKPFTSHSTPKANHRGKRKSAATQLLGRLARNGAKPLKKEYVRTQLIRGHKKALRDLRKPSKRRRSEPVLSNEPTLEQQFRSVYRRNRDLFKKVSEPSNGPLTDGKTEQRAAKQAPKTCNDTFCSEYFAHPAVRESFFYYTEMIFEGLCPVRLSEHFNARCCDGPMHDLDCTSLWTEFKEFIQASLLETLGLAPFRPQDEPTSLVAQEESSALYEEAYI